MRFLLLSLALIALILPLAACNGCGLDADPFLKVRSPLWLGSDPVIAPSGYAVRQRVQTQYVEIPQAQQYVDDCAPAYRYQRIEAPRAVSPCVDPGQPYSPPPVPGDEIPDSIPAIRRN